MSDPAHNPPQGATAESAAEERLAAILLPGSMSLRDAARTAFMGGFELRVAFSPSRGLVIERRELGRDLIPAYIERKSA